MLQLGCHAAVKTVKPASSVTGSCSGFFDKSNPEQKCLVTAAASTLRLYKVETQEETTLAHRCRISFAAPILEMRAFRRDNQKHDSLLILFDSLHLSVVEFNPSQRTFDTVAAFFLGDLSIPPQQADVPPVLTVDTQHNCAAVLVHHRYLFLVPLCNIEFTGTKLAATQQQVATSAAPNALDDWGDEDDEEQVQKADVESGAVDTDAFVAEFAHPILLDISQDISGSIQQVRDVCFATGYDEPTIAFLSENDSTWAGRVKRFDSTAQGGVQSNFLACRCTWVTFDITLLRNAWGTDRTNIPHAQVAKSLKAIPVGSVDRLPFTASQIIPLQCDSGHLPALLCLSANAILHISPKRSLAATLNAHGEEEFSQPHDASLQWRPISWSSSDRQDFGVDLVGGVMVQLNPESCIVAAESGSVYNIDFVSNGGAIHEMQLSLVGITPPGSTLSELDADLIFLGSALGDSMALKLKTTVTNSTKRIRLKVRTVIMNTGPAVCSTVVDASSSDALGQQAEPEQDGEKTANPYEELFQKLDKPVENEVASLQHQMSATDIVSCVGHGYSGALCVTRQSVRTEVVLQNDRVDAVSVFNVELRSAKKRQRAAEDDQGEFTSLLFFSTNNLTFIVGAGEKIRQLPSDQTQFCTTARTVFATGVTSLGVVVQVTDTAVWIEKDSGPVQQINWNSISASPAKRALLLDGKEPRVFISLVDGTLVSCVLNNLTMQQVSFGENVVVNAVAHCREHDLLFASTQDGDLLIQRGSETPVSVKRFACMPSTVVDLGFEEPPVPPKLVAKGIMSLPTITEMVATRLSHNERCDDDLTLAVTTSTGELIIYNVEPQTLNFYKVHQVFHDRERVEEDAEVMNERQRRLAEETEGDARTTVRDVTLAARENTSRIRVFSDLNGYNGIYVCGQRSFMIVSNRGETICHRHQTTGATRSFCEINSALVQHGFVICGEGFVQFSQLPTTFDFRQQWPTFKTPLKATPHFVGYLDSHRSCVVITSKKTPYRLCRAPFDFKYRTEKDEETGNVRNTGEPIPNEVIIQPVSAEERIPVPMVDRYEVSLFNATTWNQTSDPMILLENEQVLCAREVQISCEKDFGMFQKTLNNPEHLADPKNYTTIFAVGTGFALGEDVPSCGRLLLFTVKVIGGVRSLHLLHEENMKGSVTSVCSMQGHIVAAVGPTVKLYYYQWGARQLMLNSFFFANLYVAKLEACKNYLQVSDAFQSISFLKYSHHDRTLRVLARDLYNQEVLEANFLFRANGFSLVSTDARRNMFLFSYAPKGGVATNVAAQHDVTATPLKLEADFRISGPVHSMLRFRVPSLNVTSYSDRTVLLFITREGEIGFVQTITEKANRPLRWLGGKLAEYLPHHGGLHPVASRTEKQEGRAAKRQAPSHMVALDEVEHNFIALNSTERRVLAHSAGLNEERILNILHRQTFDTQCFF